MTSSSRIEQPARPIDAKLLRMVCGHFVTGVTVITSEEDGIMTGTTVNSFASVSLDPPLVLFCLHRDSRLLDVVRRSGRFGVNFLAGRQERLAWAFASRRQAAELRQVAHHRSAEGVPVLSEAAGFLACSLVREYDGGDHLILLGEVVELGVPGRLKEPLIFFRGAMSVLEDADQVPHPFWDG
jgi:flavin reductase (DIM6/NTAB) family NADH-FMN oxidoreductase RutF